MQEKGGWWTRSQYCCVPYLTVNCYPHSLMISNDEMQNLFRNTMFTPDSPKIITWHSDNSFSKILRYDLWFYSAPRFLLVLLKTESHINFSMLRQEASQSFRQYILSRDTIDCAIIRRANSLPVRESGDKLLRLPLTHLGPLCVVEMDNYCAFKLLGKAPFSYIGLGRPANLSRKSLQPYQ